MNCAIFEGSDQHPNIRSKIGLRCWRFEISREHRRFMGKLKALIRLSDEI